jgi:hypothetical protein
VTFSLLTIRFQTTTLVKLISRSKPRPSSCMCLSLVTCWRDEPEYYEEVGISFATLTHTHTHTHTQSCYVFLLDTQTGNRTRPLEQRSFTVATLIFNNSVLIYSTESNLYFARKSSSDSLLHQSTNTYVYYLQILVQYQQHRVRKSSPILVYRPSVLNQCG